jgi:hypothetical protein
MEGINMKPIKNKKRIDPRYFLNETVLEESAEAIKRRLARAVASSKGGRWAEKTPEEREKEKAAAAATRAAPYKEKAAQYEKDKAAAEKQPQEPEVVAAAPEKGQTGAATPEEAKRTKTQRQVNDAFDQLRRLVKIKPKPGSPHHERMKKFAKIIQTAQVQYPDLVDKQQLQWLADGLGDAGISLDVETTQKKIAAGGEAIPSVEKPLRRREANKLYMKGVRALGKSKWHEISYKHPLRVAWKKTRKNPKKYSAELRRAVAQAASGESA